jgi:hypothetical protein
MSDTRKELVRAYEALRQNPFPVGSDDDDAGELHADLALLNTELNGLIVRSLGGGARRDRLVGPEEEWRYRDLRHSACSRAKRTSGKTLLTLWMCQRCQSDRVRSACARIVDAESREHGVSRWALRYLLILW